MLQNLYLHDLLYMCEMGCFLNSFHIIIIIAQTIGTFCNVLCIAYVW